MGLTLGLIGAGGSILTVPILVYMLGIKPIVATGYSLFIVGSAATAGAARYWRQGMINVKAALTFAPPAMLTVLATRSFIIPALPDTILGVEKNILIIMLFALLMITASYFMLKPIKAMPNFSHNIGHSNFLKLVFSSAGVGLLTGLVGAGGGFLVVPSLITLFGLSVKEAIGTSLTIIAINSLMGFNGDIAAGISFDWTLLSIFIALTMLGIFTGTSLSKYISGERLKKTFGIFTLLVGVVIMVEKINSLSGIQ